MKQRLVVRAEGRGTWCVSGEGVNFYISCSDRDAALFVAHQTRNQCYPRSRVVVEEMTPDSLREERFNRCEWDAAMWSDHNE